MSCGVALAISLLLADPNVAMAAAQLLAHALRASCAGTRDSAQNEALAALTGMRRDLFPQAAPYQKEIR